MTRAPRRPRGFTLVELLITSVIVGLLAVMLPPLVIQISDGLTGVRTGMEMDRDMRLAMDAMVKLITFGRKSTVVLSTPAGEPVYSRLDFATSTGRTVALFQRGGRLIAATNGVERELHRKILRLCFFYPDIENRAVIKVGLTVENGRSGRRSASRYREAMVSMTAD